MVKKMMDVYKTIYPVLSENVTVRFKANGGIVFVDTETGQEIDQLELFIKNRLADDESRRDDNMNNIRYRGIEIEMIDVAFPVEAKFVGTSPGDDFPGGKVFYKPIAVSEMSSEWPEVLNYLKKSILITTGLGNFEGYRNILKSAQLNGINFGVKKERKDVWELTLVESRTNTEFLYSDYFVKTMDTSIVCSEYNAMCLVEKNIANVDYGVKYNDYGDPEEQGKPKLKDLDVILRIQAIADVELIIGNTGA